jgi:2-hydroxy-6-oxonona-2,4-dienedioate hydrolase
MIESMQTATCVDIDGVSTRFYDLGSGPPLLLIHGSDFGSGGAADLWHWNLSELSRSTRVIAPDRLGQGYTSGPSSTAGYRVDAVCDHIASVLDFLGLADVTLVGQSRGAFIASRVAMRRPDLASGLVLVNSASLAPAYGAYHAPARNNLHAGGAHIRRNMEWLCRQTDHIPDEWYERVARMLDRDELLKVRIEFAAEASNYYPDFDKVKAETLEWLPHFGKPTTLVWGASDHMTTVEDGLQCFSMLRGNGNDARMHLLDDSGHMPFLEYPEEFNGLVAQHLARTV